MEKAGKQQETKYTITSSDMAELQEFDQKRTLFETMTKTKPFKKNIKHMALYHALIESIVDDEDAMDKGVTDRLKKRKSDDVDKDEGPPTGPDQGLKRKKTSKETKPSKKAKSTGTSKGTTKSQPKSTGKSAQAEETMFETADTQVPQNPREDMGKTIDDGPTQNWLSDLAKAEKPSKTFNELMSTLIDFTAFSMNRLQISDLTKVDLVGPVYNLLKGTCKSYVELEYNMEECYKALNDQLDWNNPEGDRYQFDLSKPLPLVKSRNCQIVPTDYFFNNNLAYLQGGSTEITYTTSLTKMKAAKYDLQGIEDMVPILWSPIKVAYNKHAALVTKVKVNKWYGYGHLEEIDFRRSNQQLCTFIEGDFPRLHFNDIKEMLLLVVQNRLFNLKGEDIVHLAAALQGRHHWPRTIYKYSNSQGVIYLDKLVRNRLMCSYELYKFSNGTLISVWDKLKDMTNNLKMGYNSVMPRRRWSNLDKKWSRIMVKDIDRQLLERRLMRSLEKFVGGREYGEDLRLLQRTI
ncbi:hypothetical protein Tco_0418221 [Tanacetum coccineum]